MFRDRKKIKPFSLKATDGFFDDEPVGGSSPFNVTTIKHPAFNEYKQVWRNVPQDILYKYLADNHHPDWDIALPDSINDIINANPSLEIFIKHLALDIEIYRQDISQDIYNERVRLINSKIASYQQLAEDGKLIKFADSNTLKLGGFIVAEKHFLFIMENMQGKNSDEILVKAHINILISRFMKNESLTNACLSVIEVLKKLDYKDFATADISKRKKSMMVDFNKYSNKYKEQFHLSFEAQFSDAYEQTIKLVDDLQDILKKVKHQMEIEGMPEDEMVKLKATEELCIKNLEEAKIILKSWNIIFYKK